MALSETDRVYDELLVTLVKAGDRRAGERLAARWQPRLIRTARRLLRDDDAALDAVQEAWIGIFRGAARLDDPARFPAWAFGILHRKCADRIRRARRDRGTPAKESAVEGAEDRLAIDQAMAALGIEHRAAAALYFGEGLTLAEVAAATGVPLGTAKSRIFHARRQLAAALSGDEQ
jgi:RNA polymerase sigma-70 factor (ECF subfamily)